ncbi:MAG TPA: hypothetical protein VMI54_28505 [Polyangiaceae bacterium]|nr:hypothetical protein [Polyangiaceae bacterium]
MKASLTRSASTRWVLALAVAGIATSQGCKSGDDDTGSETGGSAGAAAKSGTAGKSGGAGTSSTAGKSGSGTGGSGSGGKSSGGAGPAGGVSNGTGGNGAGGTRPSTGGTGGMAGEAGGGAAGEAGSGGTSGPAGQAGEGPPVTAGEGGMGENNGGAAGAAPVKCTDANVSFDDDFSAGLRSRYWTVTQSLPGLFSVDATHGDVRLAKVSTNTGLGAVQTIAVGLNLSELASSFAGNFDYSVDFSDPVLGSAGVDQVELHANFADASYFFDVYDNSSGLNVHVWNGSINGETATSATAGTFRLTRAGSTVSGYFNGGLIFSLTDTSPLTTADFILQLQPNSDDDISVTYDNFHFTAACTE